MDVEPVSGPLPGTIGSPVDIGGALTRTPVAPQSAASAAPVTTHAAVLPSQTHPATPQVDPVTGQVLTPVKMLDRYLTRWTIRVRCSAKTDMKDYNSNDRPGRLFSVTLVDESADIRATMFNEAADKFYSIFTPNGMYVISNGKLNFAKKQYTSVKHAYELVLNSDSIVTPVESVASVPAIHFDFMPIDHIQEAKKDDMIDIIGVVLSAKPVTQQNIKGRETSRRNVTFADQSGRAIDVTLWGNQALGFDEVLASHGAHPVIALKGARVSDFSGRSLSALNSTEFELDPDIEAAHVVTKWWATVPDEGRHIPNLSGGGGGGSAGASAGGGKEKTLSSIDLEGLGLSGQDYLFVPNIYVTRFKREGTLWYKACANPDCKGRKVFEENGNFKCTNCGGVNAFRLRWVSNITAFDHTALQYISGFGDAGVTLLGHEADEVERLFNSGQSEEVDKIYKSACYKSYNMKLAVKMEDYQGTPKTKVSIQSISPVDYVVDSERLLGRIAELQRQ